LRDDNPPPLPIHSVLPFCALESDHHYVHFILNEMETQKRLSDIDVARCFVLSFDMNHMNLAQFIARMDNTFHIRETLDRSQYSYQSRWINSTLGFRFFLAIQLCDFEVTNLLVDVGSVCRSALHSYFSFKCSDSDPQSQLLHLLIRHADVTTADETTAFLSRSEVISAAMENGKRDDVILLLKEFGVQYGQKALREAIRRREESVLQFFLEQNVRLHT